ncbi:MAG: 2-iminoacetate synthase ThiH [Chitinispirillales bacterium]|jgi:2-iminoacetate synthase|nr:2-iminoacetate synthase ThiH [Chitinispirillales bacterium]
MSFADILKRYDDFDVGAYCAGVDESQVERVLSKPRLSDLDYLALLSDAASTPKNLELIAARARDITRKQFGSVIFLFTPLYVSNVCDNYCPYCSFAHQNKIKRRHLKVDEVRAEAKRIAATGLRHILMLTGESRKGASVRYLKECVSVLREYFSSIAIEVYPLDKCEYSELVESGADGLTIYQETYDMGIYESLHKGGPKADFGYRLLAPERACEAGMRAVTVGALLGLAKPTREAFMTGLHAKYIREKYPSVEIAASFPRLRPQAGEFEPKFCVGDRAFVQYMAALRLFIPSAGITVSTRESARFRDSILPIGPTKMSAGVSTAVGEGSGDASDSQFEIADSRTVSEMQKNLLSQGFQPVLVDWNYILCREGVC